ncbi:MAG: hypothetical protein CND86_04810 [Bacteroidetes bacterium MED-G21]|nr:MAG: hypothetical protein CND86_04810 [Bacteroidetes bacterium MED-G21]
MKSLFSGLIILTLLSCNSSKNIGDYWNYNIPNKDFTDSIISLPLDYGNSKNWMFYADNNNPKEILPKNYKNENDSFHDVSVFYIHPTTLYDGTNWNADTSFFRNNKLLRLCLENQASVFAGITKLYAPHYREMHIYSYTDTVNGYKAFDVAYQDVLEAFKHFINKNPTNPIVIASHSQGTNHAVRLINDYISLDESLKERLVLSYLIGMDVNKNEIPIEVCKNAYETNCFLSWRSFNESYYPRKWRYGNNIASVNPITFDTDSIWSGKNKHMGVLMPNQKIRFKKTITASNHLGMVWVKFPNNIIFNKFKSNNYHRADFNLYWMNMRENLKLRLKQL